jgi:tetratricopeptide (TPR) repeat protein
MTGNWSERVALFWASADDADPTAALQAMRALVAERPEGDEAALFEWASVHDFLGREQEAIPLYRAALAAGLTDGLAEQAVVQLASSLRVVGDPDAAVALLESHADPTSTTGAARQAFLALALHDAGRPTEALRVALLAIAPTLPRYGRVLAGYAAALTDD